MEGLIDVSKLSSDKFDQNFSWFNMQQVVKDIFGMLDFLAKHHNTKLNYSAINCKEVESDSIRIQVILINLINNSFKTTHDGTINVKISYEEQSNFESSS